ncbi:FecR domain-containing protein [Patescibacteria group bacterium]|nr:FecR domain-containing protein [Patescibacteria group bacterium]MBU1684913.1 FecR domain-containing protein [Patescibacteria group bacterium]
MKTPKIKNPLFGIHSGFTLVELLLVIAIITILSTVAVIAYPRTQIVPMNNKVADDLEAIKSAMEQYKVDHEGKYPVPLPNTDKNLLCFYADTAYAHDCAAADFIQAQVDNTLLTKRYLQEVPTDPRTGTRYAYGVTTDGRYYQVAGLIEGEDGTWTARVSGNLHFTYPLKSLIRSYNGPDFVMDGESFLPYSANHLAVSAMLADISGEVKVGGTAVTPASSDEQKTVKPGAVITTGPASSVSLWFSDGSVTWLEENTTLRVLPNTETEKNDRDGIITKIRLKLTSGKIWNKVVRLAEKSEFNVETTSAIAGVRGTEFGIDAAGNELIVLSGTVVARRFAPGEAVSADSAFEFDNSNTFFSINQVINGDGSFKTFPVPDYNAVSPSSGTTLPSVAQQAISQKYYRQPYNNNLEPRLNELDVPNKILSLRLFEKGTNNPYDLLDISKIHVYEKETMNPLTVWDESKFTVDSLENTVTILPAIAHDFFQSHEDVSIVLVFEDTGGNLSALIHPPIRIRFNARLTWLQLFGDWTPKKKKISGCSGTYVSHTVSGPSVVLAGSAGKYKAVAAYTGPSCTQDITTSCSWKNPPNGTIDANGKFTPNTTGTATITCDFNSNSAASPPTVSIISKLNASCRGADLAKGTPDDKGYWDDPACWVLADPNTNCDSACNTKISAICEDSSDGKTDWDDDSALGNPICVALTGKMPFGDAGSTIEYAPYLFVSANRCYSRKNSITTFTPDLCATTKGLDVNRQRVCKCI